MPIHIKQGGQSAALFDSVTPLRLPTGVPISTSCNEDIGTDMVWCHWLSSPRSLSSCQIAATFTHGCTAPRTPRSKPQSTPVINPCHFQHPSWKLLWALLCLSATPLSKNVSEYSVKKILNDLWQMGNCHGFHVWKKPKQPTPSNIYQLISEPCHYIPSFIKN